MSDKITRKELLDLLNRSKHEKDNSDQLDELDSKAMEGYQYLDKDQHPDGALNSLDEKFDKWLSDKEVSRGKKVRKMTPRSTYFMVNRGENTSVETSIYSAFALYEKGDYRAAARAISALKADHPDKKGSKILRGHQLTSCRRSRCLY
ncbi:MAG: hypothetical protein IPL46_12485 [Saprospiraceae bacterium]|nr:hypothetical protein [Saprospiraceae bacterium]